MSLKTKIVFFLFLFTLCYYSFFPSQKQEMTGVYWGAFDPPTTAHKAIIEAAIAELPLKNFVIVVNNHSYKNYTFSLEKRLSLIEEIILPYRNENILVVYQDDTHKMDWKALKELFPGPLYAIAGYDSYKKWTPNSTKEERALYDVIAVIPRSGTPPLLEDQNAVILSIPEEFAHVSSTAVKSSLFNNQH